MRRKASPLIWAAVALAVFVGAWWQQRADSAPKSAPTIATSPSVAASPSEMARPSEGVSPTGHASPSKRASLAVAASGSEREQLEKTLALIERGGPFAHKQDASVFSNREQRLPSHPRGYYREYTVPTVGAKNRGARRVVRGKAGETWYTRDHYRTFVRIDE